MKGKVGVFGGICHNGTLNLPFCKRGEPLICYSANFPGLVITGARTVPAYPPPPPLTFHRVNFYGQDDRKRLRKLTEYAYYADMKAKQFGPTVREIREAAGINLRELARRLGWSPAYVSDIERGLRNPPGRATQIAVWADAIGAGNLEELMELAERGRPRRCTDCSLTGG